MVKMNKRTIPMPTEPDAFKQVEKVLNGLRPSLQADDGDAEIARIDVANGTVYLHLQGACETCPMSVMTLKGIIEQVMKRELSWVNSVEAI
jgi:Fe-S cluster biogenesis protein NfuA